MTDLEKLFASAHRRDVTYVAMRETEVRGERVTELYFMSETGQPIVFRMTEEGGNAGWFRGSMRDFAAKLAKRADD